ncbi:MAG: hypothetical protein ABJA82_01670 [Myxococcales bacterium]
MLAEKHALSCADCRAALNEGVRLVALLQRALPLHIPASQPLRGQLPQALPSDRSYAGMGEKDAVRRLGWATAGAVAVAWMFQLAVGSGFEVTLKSVLVSWGVLALAIGSVVLMRGKERFAVFLVIAASALFAYLSGTGHGLQPDIGLRCMFREIWAVAITWAIVMTAGRQFGLKLGRRRVTAVAAAGALAAHAGQHLACEVPHSDAHLLIFHFGGVVLAVALGAAAAGLGAGRGPGLTVSPRV